MKKTRQFNQVLVAFGLTFLFSAVAAAQPYRGMEPQSRTAFGFLPETIIDLTDWFIQSSARIKQGGERWLRITSMRMFSLDRTWKKLRLKSFRSPGGTGQNFWLLLFQGKI